VLCLGAPTTRERRGGFACCRGEEDLDRDGLLVVCSTTDQQCLNSATKITTPRTQRTTLTLWHSFSGYTVGYSSFTVTIVPPTSERRASRAGRRLSLCQRNRRQHPWLAVSYVASSASPTVLQISADSSSAVRRANKPGASLNRTVNLDTDRRSGAACRVHFRVHEPLFEWPVRTLQAAATASSRAQHYFPRATGNRGSKLITDQIGGGYDRRHAGTRVDQGDLTKIVAGL
jgi:hypothetical protein